MASSSSSTGATTHFNVATALAILSHKPSDQSLPSFLIDLKARFPLRTPNLKTASQSQDVNQSFDEDNAWRRRALALEKENEALKLLTKKQELEVMALKLVSNPPDDSNEDKSGKKKKKVGRPVPDKQDVRTLVKNLRSGPHLPTLKDSLDVLTSFQIIQSVDVRGVLSEEDRVSILLPNIKRSLFALGKLLTALLDQDASIVASSSRVNIAKCLRDLLLSLLNSTLPLDPNRSILPHILGELTGSIISPIIRGFHDLTVHQLEIMSGVKEKCKSQAPPDIRPNLLAVLEDLLPCLRSLHACTRDLQKFMILEAANEIQTRWSVKIFPQSLDSEKTRRYRIERLARKDSLWFQCFVLHVALEQLPSAIAGDNSDWSLLSSLAVQVLAGLVHHLDSHTSVDEVAKDMVLASVEKAWLMGFDDTCPGTEEPV